ncbi:MAG: LPS export ABC transporter permease LptF [Chromatiaceae bacterium]|nr:LPS export ABC transporter permease LptF [Candidatus Thioaporhodococcus sediminis]
MRLFRNALLREMTATGGIALGALSAIVIVIQVVRILGKAATGDILGSAVLPLLAFGYLHFLPILLSLSLFMAVFLTLTRFWQDSEMVIWSSAGLGPRDWIRGVLHFAVPVTLLIAFMSLILIPWAAQERAEYEQTLSAREDVAALTPGVFFESPRENRVFFLEGLDEETLTARNLFIEAEQHGRPGIVVAQEGHVSEAEGIRYLVLDRGRRYEGMPGSADYRVVEFERYSFRLEPTQMGALKERPKQLPTLDLLRDPSPDNQAEMLWRVGHPLSALVLALLAIPLSFFNPRGGRSLNALLAMLTYTTYNNLIGVSEGWVSHGQLGAPAALALIHGGALAIVAAAFWWRYGRRLGAATA